MDIEDCIFPDCQIPTEFGKACEHSCPFERSQKMSDGKYPPDNSPIFAAMRDAEVKAWEALRGYKFWMFGYHAARWVNYNQLLPTQRRFRSPFKSLVEIADRKTDKMQAELPIFEISALPLLEVLGSEGDGG